MRIILLGLCMVLSVTHAFAQAKYINGRDFKTLSNSHAVARNNKIIITEFFSYGCPWCYKLEPSIEAWQKNLPKTVTFNRVPVVFERGWQYYAKAYYAADALGLVQKLNPLIFNAIHKQHKNLKSDGLLIKFFTQHGVDKNTANNIFKYSPAINAQVKLGEKLMQQYQITGVPAFIVDGRYRVDLLMSKGDIKKLIATLNFLIKKTKA